MKFEVMHYFQIYAILKKVETIKFLKHALNFSFREWRGNEAHIAEKYSWSITQLAA